MTVVPIVIEALGTVSHGFERPLEELELGGRAKTIQTTALLRSAKILRRVLKFDDESFRYDQKLNNGN